MTPSDRVRDYAYRQYVLPARLAGSPTVTIEAGPIHAALCLTRHNLVQVCDALRSQKFLGAYGLGFVSRSGPKQGKASTFTFSL
jgi:hypothetical protein